MSYKSGNGRAIGKIIKALLGILIIAIGLVVGYRIIASGNADDTASNVDSDAIKLEAMENELAELEITYSNSDSVDERSELGKRIVSLQGEIQAMKMSQSHSQQGLGVDLNGSIKIIIAIMINLVTLGIGLLLIFASRRKQILKRRFDDVVPVVAEAINELEPACENAIKKFKNNK